MYRILVVDDELHIRESLRTLFEFEIDCEVDECSDGIQGNYNLLKMQYDLIVSDIKMPNMNGIEFLETIKKEKLVNQKTKLIFYSGYLDQTENLKDTPGVFFLNKPAKSDTILTMVKKALNLNH